MKKSKKILAGVLATVSMMSCMAMPTMAASNSFTNYTSGITVSGAITVEQKYTYASTSVNPNYNGVSVRAEFTYMVGADSYTAQGSTVNGQKSISTTVHPASEHPTARGVQGKSWHSGPYVTERELFASRV